MRDVIIQQVKESSNKKKKGKRESSLVVCAYCDGSGRDPDYMSKILYGLRQCPTCGGKGKVRVN